METSIACSVASRRFSLEGVMLLGRELEAPAEQRRDQVFLPLFWLQSWWWGCTGHDGVSEGRWLSIQTLIRPLPQFPGSGVKFS